MEDTNDIQRIIRSKNQHTALYYFNRSFSPVFLVVVVVLLLLSINSFCRESSDFLDIALIILDVSVCYLVGDVLVNKGSLVEEVAIDRSRREIQVIHYRLWGQRCERKIPFDGFSWSVSRDKYDGDRVRIYPKQGRRIVVVENKLGWNTNDVKNLIDALSQIKKSNYQ